MTSADETTQEPTDPEDPFTSTNKPNKKSKSKGFIESTSFKPSWLETGPLSPEMLPTELVAPVETATADGEEISDDLVAQLAELERLYSEAGEGEPSATIVTESVGTDEEPPAVTAEETDVVPAAAVITAENESVADGIEEVEIVAEVTDISTVEDASEPGEVVESDLMSAPAESEAEQAVIHVDAEDEIEDSDLFIEEAIVTPAVAEAVAMPMPVAAKKEKPKRKHPVFDGLAQTLLFLGLLLLGLAALNYFLNPFARLALSTADVARPAVEQALNGPAGADTNWCVTGGFQADGDSPLRMQDNGSLGDIIAGDQVFALQTDTIAPGAYPWQVVGCELGDLVYPLQSSWIQVDSAGQPVTFMFDSRERDEALFYPIPFVVSAIDGANDFQVVGSFQDWNADDTSGQLQHLGGGVYQQVRQIARPGKYEAYIINGGEPEQAIDAYGRTSDPIPFLFETSGQSDSVVFYLDTNRGRASVLYGMPWLARQLGYGWGYRLLSLLLGLGGLLLLAWMLYRMLRIGNDANWLEAGCPQCGHHELMRISRRPIDHFLNALRIPSYRYQCRNCTWTGSRLSEDGAPVSPGATTIMA